MVGKDRRLPAATAATTTAAATTATAAGTTATAATSRTLLRFVNTERTAAHVFAIQCLNSTSRIGTRHFHKAKTTRAAGFAIIDERNRFHSTVSFEQATYCCLVCRKRQITNIDLSHINTVSLKKPRAHYPC
jgi:hypothetical protein